MSALAEKLLKKLNAGAIADAIKICENEIHATVAKKSYHNGAERLRAIKAYLKAAGKIRPRCAEPIIYQGLYYITCGASLIEIPADLAPPITSDAPAPNIEHIVNNTLYPANINQSVVLTPSDQAAIIARAKIIADKDPDSYTLDDLYNVGDQYYHYDRLAEILKIIGGRDVTTLQIIDITLLVRAEHGRALLAPVGPSYAAECRKRSEQAAEIAEPEATAI